MFLLVHKHAYWYCYGFCLIYSGSSRRGCFTGNFLVCSCSYNLSASSACSLSHRFWNCGVHVCTGAGLPRAVGICIASTCGFLWWSLFAVKTAWVILFICLVSAQKNLEYTGLQTKENKTSVITINRWLKQIKIQTKIFSSWSELIFLYR